MIHAEHLYGETLCSAAGGMRWRYWDRTKEGWVWNEGHSGVDFRHAQLRALIDCPYCAREAKLRTEGTPVDELVLPGVGLAVRVINALHAEGIYTIEYLERHVRLVDLLRVPNFGKKSFASLSAALAARHEAAHPYDPDAD